MTRSAVWFPVMVFAFALFLFVQAGPSSAQEETAGGWEIDVVPYMWLLAVDGSTNLGGIETHIHESIGDVLGDTNIAGMAYLEASRNNYGFFIEPLYAHFKAHGSVSGVDVTAKTNWWLIDAGGFYRLTKWGDRKRDDQSGFVDLLGGLRYWDLESKIAETIPGLGTLSVRKDDSWVDPFIGARMRAFFNKKTFIDARGDIGGFGISSKSSHFTWNAHLTLGYYLSRSTAVMVGYRALNLDRDEGTGKDRFKWDATMHGPLVAFGISFP